MTASFTISETEEGLRLDKILAERFPTYSRTYFQYLIEEKFVLVNEKPLKKKDIAGIGDVVSIAFKSVPAIDLVPQPVPLSILYEDEFLIAIDKQAGLVVHPGAGNPDNTFINGLIHHLGKAPEGGEALRPGVVHRLDKETSGVLIAAKTSTCHALLVDQFKNREVEKHYLALTSGVPKGGTICNLVGRHPYRRQEMCVREEGGKMAETHIEVLAQDGKIALVLAKPKTGRTHQIRVHLKHAGAPILFDPVYGSKHPSERMMLHARRLLLKHPITKQTLKIEAPIPEDFNKIMKRLENL